MALINCPGCGGSISDKAASCPKCGYTINAAPIVQSEYKPTKTMKSGIVKKIAAAVIAVAVICAGGFAAYKFIPRSIKVSNVLIDNWTFVDDDDDGKYIASVSSPTKETFIAVVTKKETNTEKYDDSDSEETKSSDSTDKKPDYEPITFSPDNYVLMKDGKGDFKIDGDNEPNDYQINYYLSGRELSAKRDFEKIEFDYLGYDDNDAEKETRVYFNVDLKLKKDLTGLLFFTIHNKLTDITSEIEYAAIVNGESVSTSNGGKKWHLYEVTKDLFGSDLPSCDVEYLPYKTRDNNAFEVQNIYFVPSKNISSIVDGKFYIEDIDILQLTLCEGEAEIPEKIDGYLIYSDTLQEGGEPSKIGNERFNAASISNGFAHLSVADYFEKKFFESNKFKDPSYSINYYGYVEAIKICS